jgi:sterol desaturase/sphingolipid hydroxylase (fatty acid hydroxylase superfamily)
VGPDYIALAVPFFFLLIGIEALVARRQGLRAYRFADTIADLGCGITQRMGLLALGGVLGVSYVWLYKHARLVDLGSRPAAAWVVAFLGVDLIYYLWHRASHRVNFLWAAHIVHHQSEDYNLAVALRQAVLTPLTHMPFSLVLAVLGVPPVVAAGSTAFNTLYQFWIHTETVGRLGPLEAVLNTPSHHRVHHGRNPAYLDHNYAGVLIVWDRLFGTFVAETERPRYGITTPLRSFNPIWAQVHYLVELAQLARRQPRWRDRLAVWLEPPERTAARLHAAPDTDGGDGAASDAPAPLAAKYEVEVPRRVRVYVVVNFALAVAGAFALMSWHRALPTPWTAVGGVLVVLTVASAGALVERKPWARPLEVVRVGLLVVAPAVWFAVS